MSYRVRTEHFEGPFDLLLHLVSRQKLDVAEISVADVTDQYLEHVDRMHDLDLDVASDFLLVAATLLEMKAAGLLPEDEGVLPEEYDDLSPEEAKRLLVARLLAYKQFKNVSGELSARIDGIGEGAVAGGSDPLNITDAVDHFYSKRAEFRPQDDE